MKTKKKFALLILTSFILALGLIRVVNGAARLTNTIINFVSDPVGQWELSEVIVSIPEVKAKEYAYNEQVPKELILIEMQFLANRFNFSDVQLVKWKKIIEKESQYDNLAKNPTSTALGLCQYLIGTWQETESFKQFRKARTDYKTCLWEMALDLNGGEVWRWQESLNVLGYKSF